MASDREALIAEQVAQQVAELPDRTSPDDWPEAMLVTADELKAIVLKALSATADTARAEAQSQLDAIDKIVGSQGLPDLPLVERVVLMRKQMDADDERCRVWKQEADTARAQTFEEGAEEVDVLIARERERLRAAYTLPYDVPAQRIRSATITAYTVVVELLRARATPGDTP